jgi:hypothetical protein
MISTGARSGSTLGEVTDSAWDEISQTIAAAPYPVTVLPPNPERAKECLATLGVTTRSWLGGVIAHSGGLLVDHGWLRVFGSGSGELPDVLFDTDPAAGGLVIALDVLGGQFAWVPPSRASHRPCTTSRPTTWRGRTSGGATPTGSTPCCRVR